MFAMTLRYRKIPYAVLLMVVLCLLTGCPGESSIVVPYGCEACVDFSRVATEEESKKLLDKSRCAVKPGGTQGECLVCRLDEHCQSKSAPTKKCTSDFRCICGSSKDCPEGQFCLGTKGCVQCLKDDDCKDRAKTFCVNNSCDGECKSGTTRPCFKEGACNGVQTCTKFGTWKPCTSSGGKPEKEICDQRDNDCDGLVDEDFPQVGKECNETVGVCNVKGKWACKPDFKGVVCKGDAKGATKETCNGKDDDCNGVIDDGLTAPDCKKQDGVCKGSKQKCAGEKGWLPCTDKDYTKHSSDYNPKFDGQTASSCDGVDNNCDGKVDESPAEGAETCENNSGTGVGECKKGRITCKDKKTVCSPGAPTKEVCDGKDNDCNGKIDDSFIQLGKPCSAGQGDCEEKGVFVCKKDGTGTECGAKGKPPIPESCNKKDDDCDGLVDEGLDGQDCTVGTLKGECNKGQARCNSGVLTCVQVNQPRPEVVDNKDNDCDGFVDEGIIDTLVDLKSANVSIGGIAINFKQDLYFSDEVKHTIHKLDIAKKKYTLYAGISGKVGAANNSDPLKATFNKPAQLAFDSTGTHLYVADPGNSLIRRVDGISNEVSSYVTATVGAFGLSFDTANVLYYHNINVLSTIDTARNKKDIVKAGSGSSIVYKIYGVSGINRAHTINLFRCLPFVNCRPRECRALNCHTLTVGTTSTQIGGTCNAGCFSRSSVPGSRTIYGVLGQNGTSLFAVLNGTTVYQILDKGKPVSPHKRVAGDPAKRGTSSGDKKAALSAGFVSINQLAFDKQGNMYISDKGAKNIRVVKYPY